MEVRSQETEDRRERIARVCALAPAEPPFCLLTPICRKAYQGPSHCGGIIGRMTVVKILAALWIAFSAAAAAEMPLPVLRTEATSGGSIFYIKNNSTQPLTAYL